MEMMLKSENKTNNNRWRLTRGESTAATRQQQQQQQYRGEIEKL